MYFKSQILVHEYWTMLDHFCFPVLFASGCNQHVLKNVNITVSGNTGTPEMSQYPPILGRSSIWDLKYTFSIMAVHLDDKLCFHMMNLSCIYLVCRPVPRGGWGHPIYFLFGCSSSCHLLVIIIYS